MTVFDELSRVSADNLPQFTVISGENDDIISELKTQIFQKVGFDPSDLSQAYFDMTESDPNLALEELESLPFFGDGMLVVLEIFGI
jgi:DNA polymerase-3 subunit delta